MLHVYIFWKRSPKFMCFKKSFLFIGNYLLFLLLVDVVGLKYKNCIYKNATQSKVKKIRVILGDLQCRWLSNYPNLQTDKIPCRHRLHTRSIDGSLYIFNLLFLLIPYASRHLSSSFLHCDLNFNVLLQILCFFFVRFNLSVCILHCNKSSCSACVHRRWRKMKHTKNNKERKMWVW